jgi:hypothetical protein
MKGDTIILPIKRLWFDMIKAGIKTDEYRELKKHYVDRLVVFDYPKETKDDGKNLAVDFIYDLKNGFSLDEVLKAYYAEMKPIKKVELRNGYGMRVPSITVELLGVEVSQGVTDWGAKEGELYFTLKLGRILTKYNY